MKLRLIFLTVGCATMLAANSIVVAGTPTANESGTLRHRPDRWGNSLERMTKTLNLTSDQQSQIGPILEQSRSQIQTARQESRQKISTIRDKVRTEIGPLLTSVQQQKLDEFQNARQDRNQRSAGNWFRHRRNWDNVLERMTKRLDLSADQQTKIRPILEQATPQLQAALREMRQKTLAIRDHARSQIRPLLTQAQQQKWDTIQKARNDIRKAREEMRAALARE